MFNGNPGSSQALEISGAASLTPCPKPPRPTTAHPGQKASSHVAANKGWCAMSLPTKPSTYSWFDIKNPEASGTAQNLEPGLKPRKLPMGSEDLREGCR